ncbi:MAG: hypothetical protein H6739_30140 [Alphaproteobacteria bacterium]|nr:hypothetical protein [Alphaproteobacteria bacterium]
MLLAALAPVALAVPLTLCAPDDPGLAEGRAALDALDARIASGQAEFMDILVELEVLLATPCMALARAESDVPLHFETSASLARWWSDGGARWLRSYLDPADFDRVFLPPDPRVALTLPPERPAQDLLCSARDDACASETRPWMISASRALQQHDAKQAEAPCATDDYTAWRRCMGEQGGRIDALPPGRMRPPTAGWLVIRGARDAVTPCVRITVYDLGLGSAWRARLCEGAEPRLQAGLVEVDALRELAWWLVLVGEVQPGVRSSLVVEPLPEGLARRWDDTRPAPPEEEPVETWSTSQSVISWVWTPPDDVGFEANYFTWPWSPTAAEDHASALLRAVEATFAEGCPPRKPSGQVRAGRMAGEPPGLRLEDPDVGAAPLLSWTPPSCPP